MNTYNAEIGSELSLLPRQRTVRAGFQTLTLTLFHARALFRLAHRRPLLALGLAVGSVSAISAASLEAIHVVSCAAIAAGVVPLAPAPAPPAPPVQLAVNPQHHLLGLPINPLRVNPLRGLASWYGAVWNGRLTASGEAFDETKLTAAHKTLPLGTLVRVTNLRSQQSVVVRINDRGTLAANRVIDLSSAAAREIGLLDQGLGRVKLEILGRS